jgi:uncharacterized protein (TIGR02391 family)
VILPNRIAESLTIIRPSPDGDVRVTVNGSVQTRKAYFQVNADIQEGDLIEQPIPNGKVRTYRVQNVTYHTRPSHMAHVVAEIEPVAARPPSLPRRVEIAGVHPDISVAAGALFADHHYSRAVFAAFQAVEHRIQQMTGNAESGAKLVNQVFGASPSIDVARHSGRNADDERNGFRFLLMGAILALRNPRGHGQDLPDTAEEAIEYIALASAMMRRLDQATLIT